MQLKRREFITLLGMAIVGHSITGLLFTAVLSLGMTAPARADDVADFYRGKRISLVVGYGTGGGYDLYARMLGRFLGNHIPGKPTIIAQNMPGAGSRKLALQGGPSGWDP